MGLLERMGVHAEVEGFLKEGDLCLEIKGDQEGMLIWQEWSYAGSPSDPYQPDDQ